MHQERESPCTKTLLEEFNTEADDHSKDIPKAAQSREDNPSSSKLSSSKVTYSDVVITQAFHDPISKVISKFDDIRDILFQTYG